MTTEEHVRFESDGLQLSGVLNTPDKESPVIIFSHGFGSDKSSQRLFVRAGREFAKNGLATLRFDSRGCGDSEGYYKDYNMTTKLRDIKAAVNFAKIQNNINPNKIGLTGISYGGSASIIFASKNKEIKCVDVWAPGILQEGFGPAFIEEAMRRGSVTSYFGGNVYKEQIIDDKKYNMYRQVSKLQIPIQITHGDMDRVVPLSEGEQLFENAKDPKKINIIKGAGHDFEYHRSTLIKYSIKWFKKWLK